MRQPNMGLPTAIKLGELQREGSKGPKQNLLMAFDETPSKESRANYKAEQSIPSDKGGLASRRVVELNILIRSFSCYLTIALLVVLSHLYEFLEKLGEIRAKIVYFVRNGKFLPKEIPPLCSGFDNFFIKQIFKRVNDCWDRPISSNAGRTIDLVKWEGRSNSRWRLKENKTCINLGSYNYLGFSSTGGPIEKEVLSAIDRFPIITSINRSAMSTPLLDTLEAKVALKVGKEAAAVFSMGFGTNSTFIPFLTTKGDLVISDQKNHSSMVNGFFASECSVRVFKHNDTEELEKTVREEIIRGQPRINRAWNRIFIFIEGLYSMEGHYAKLKEIVAIKKKYKCYLYIDEAHSFGAVGRTGRGVCEKFDIDPKDVDIIMGTFTKSYAGFGGFIASSEEVVSAIKSGCQGFRNSESLPPAVCQQIVSAMDAIAPGGSEFHRIEDLHFKTNYFRNKLVEMGFDILGGEDSPVIILLLGSCSVTVAFSRECLKRDLAVVVVGFPATAITMARARFCISSAHTMEDLNASLKVISDVGDLLRVKYRKRLIG